MQNGSGKLSNDADYKIQIIINQSSNYNLNVAKYFSSFCKNNFLEQLPAYTKSQLALRNGNDKPEVWIAYKGIIYDVTTSRLWRNGKHYEHWAGQDLTDELPDAPHTEKVFERVKVIGKLV